MTKHTSFFNYRHCIPVKEITMTGKRPDGSTFTSPARILGSRDWGTAGKRIWLVAFSPNNRQYMGAEDVAKFSGYNPETKAVTPVEPEKW